MTQPIAALPANAPLRDPDAASPVIEHDAIEQAKIWSSDEGGSFLDVLDAVNPLQHVPVVSTIYRAVTGDQIGLAPRMIGAAIFGGPLGIILAGLSALFEEASGGDVADHMVALFDDAPEGGDTAPVEYAASEGTYAPATTPTASQEIAEPPNDPTKAPSVPTADAGRRENPPHVPATVDVAVISEPLAPNPVPAQAVQISEVDADSKRIARSLLESQRIQANLLLANLRARQSLRSNPLGGKDLDDDGNGRPHSNLPPADARPTWIAGIPDPVTALLESRLLEDFTDELFFNPGPFGYLFYL